MKLAVVKLEEVRWLPCNVRWVSHLDNCEDWEGLAGSMRWRKEGTDFSWRVQVRGGSGIEVWLAGPTHDVAYYLMTKVNTPST